jgi:hypothetical protein
MPQASGKYNFVGAPAIISDAAAPYDVRHSLRMS